MAILEEETFKKFGYYPSDLKPQSYKRILAKCDECGKIREIRKDAYRSLCISCAKSSRHLSEGTKRRMSEAHKGIHPSEKTKKKQSDVQSGEKNPMFGKKGKNHPAWKGGKVKRKCLICGKEFEVSPCTIKRGNGKFDSYSCARKAKRIPQHHTKPELIFEQICKKNNLPFKYTGDGSFWMGKNPAVNPDFVNCNGKKMAVEIFSYWHDPLRRHCKVPYSQTYKGRKEILKKYGWKLVVFWQEDLECEDAEQFVLNSLKKNGV